MKIGKILGLNARTQLFAYKYNTRRGKNIADSKIQTARILKNAEVPHPDIYKKFMSPNDVYEFDWTGLPDKFALKPSKGMGGEGIIVVKKKLKDGGWLTTQRTRVKIDDLKLHTLDILEGAFSMGNVPDTAFIQEYVGRAKAFRRWAYRGTPDVRIIVFNKVPIMAMLRLPTKESGGRANLHQGAIGVGVDIATGITTTAIWHGEQIVFKPGTERRLRGIKIPGWTAILETAVRAQIASGLGYAGVDIVLHPEKGPQVLELNAQPGLQIQLANMEGLKKRLERVEDLNVTDAQHGVMIAKALFAGRFESRKAVEEGIKTLKGLEVVKIYSFDKTKKTKVQARVDTGAVRSSIDRRLAEDLGLMVKGNILWKDKYRSATGLQARPIIGIQYVIAGKKISSTASVTDRSKMSTRFLMGRSDMAGFLVNPNSE
jgi:alpha-L-glutamate ligase-like protein